MRSHSIIPPISESILESILGVLISHLVVSNIVVSDITVTQTSLSPTSQQLQYYCTPAAAALATLCYFVLKLPQFQNVATHILCFLDLVLSQSPTL